MDPSLLATFRVAIYGVLVEDGTVLLTNTRVPSGIVTNFPGGGVALGEAPIDALAREFMEETGIVVSIERLLFCSQAFQQNPEYPREQLIHMYYQVRRTGGDIQHRGNYDDVDSVIWRAPGELTALRILAADQEFISHSSFRNLFRARNKMNLQATPRESGADKDAD